MDYWSEAIVELLSHPDLRVTDLEKPAFKVVARYYQTNGHKRPYGCLTACVLASWSMHTKGQKQFSKGPRIEAWVSQLPFPRKTLTDPSHRTL